MGDSAGAGTGAGGVKKAVRKPRAKTQYIVVKLDNPRADGRVVSASVLHYGPAKSEPAAWELAAGADLTEGRHTLALASVREVREMNIEVRRVVEYKKQA
jgi:hypothetical protein